MKANPSQIASADADALDAISAWKRGRSSVADMVRIGRELTVLKASTVHGDFIPRLTRLNVHLRQAQCMMQVAARFMHRPNTVGAVRSHAQLVEMLALTDENCSVLERTGELNGLTLSDLAVMSVKDTRAAVRALVGDENRAPDRQSQCRASAQAEEKAASTQHLSAGTLHAGTAVSGASTVSAVSLQTGRAAVFAAMWAKHGRIDTPKTAAAAVAIGAQLQLLREAEPNGRWRDHVNAMGLAVATAEQYMTAARRFGALPEPFLAAAGSATKLLALLALSTAEMEALVAGLPIQPAPGRAVPTLDLQQLAAMTDAELQSAMHSLRGKAQMPLHGVQLTPEEEAMLRSFRKCAKPARALLLQTAQLLADRPA